MRYITSKDIKLRKRKPLSHKGDFGKVLVIGGSEDYVGAPALAGLASLRAGADMAVIAAPEKAAWAINCLSPDLITRKFEGRHFSSKHADAVIRLARSADAVVIGPGLGSKSGQFTGKVLKKLSSPVVVDADAIKSISLKDADNAVLTPHAKELEALLSNSGIKEKSLQKSLGNNVVLAKGKIDRIISWKRIAYNKTGSPGMTVGGTGDVLAGLTAGFLAQDYSLFDSACWAAYINGRLGKQLEKKKGYSFIASDLVEDMQKVVDRLRKT
mgnify:CR=1 FL=1